MMNEVIFRQKELPTDFERDKIFFICARHYIRTGLTLEQAIHKVRGCERAEGDLNRLYCAVLRDEEILRKIESGELPSPVMANIIAIIDGEKPKAG